MYVCDVQGVVMFLGWTKYHIKKKLYFDFYIYCYNTGYWNWFKVHRFNELVWPRKSGSVPTLGKNLISDNQTTSTLTHIVLFHLHKKMMLLFSLMYVLGPLNKTYYFHDDWMNNKTLSFTWCATFRKILWSYWAWCSFCGPFPVSCPLWQAVLCQADVSTRSVDTLQCQM